MVYGEAGRKPLSETIKVRMVCFWHKIITGDKNKLSSKLLTLTKKLHEQNFHTSPWLNKIENILNSCGMRNVWINPEHFKHEWLKKAIDLRLSDMYRQEWNSMVTSMSSCILYRSFKLDLNLENYLMLLDSTERINICRFRCRNTKIPVVTLSYAIINRPYEDRICAICNMNEVGDEFHYIFKCPIFHSHRNKYLSNYYKLNPNMIKFSQLFQTDNITILKKLAKLIAIINKKFR